MNNGFKVWNKQESEGINDAILLIDQVDTSLHCDNFNKELVHKKIKESLNILQNITSTNNGS